MATYKVIQDIEAEDKLLGPLSLRQFIYVIIAGLLGFTAFKIAVVKWYIAIPFLPPMVLFGILAAPFGHDQPSEVWLLAKIRFALKPRRRIWDQNGAKHLVTITVPKKIDHHYTDGLSQTEVKSRLKALADTIDSRGWAVKSTSMSPSPIGQMAYGQAYGNSERLLSLSDLPQEVPTYQLADSDDIMDTQHNPTAQKLNDLMMASARTHRAQAVATMQPPVNQPAATPNQPNDYWFMNQPNPAQVAQGYAAFGAQTITPDPTLTPTPEPPPLSDSHIPIYGHSRVINPITGNFQSSVVSRQSEDRGQTTDDRRQEAAKPAILELANNDDLNVATIAREANRATKKQSANDEIVVPLR